MKDRISHTKSFEKALEMLQSLQRKCRQAVISQDAEIDQLITAIELSQKLDANPDDRESIEALAKILIVLMRTMNRPFDTEVH